MLRNIKLLSLKETLSCEQQFFNAPSYHVVNISPGYESLKHRKFPQAKSVFFFSEKIFKGSEGIINDKATTSCCFITWNPTRYIACFWICKQSQAWDEIKPMKHQKSVTPYTEGALFIHCLVGEYCNQGKASFKLINRLIYKKGKNCKQMTWLTLKYFLTFCTCFLQQIFYVTNLIFLNFFL